MQNMSSSSTSRPRLGYTQSYQHGVSESSLQRSAYRVPRKALASTAQASLADVRLMQEAPTSTHLQSMRLSTQRVDLHKCTRVLEDFHSRAIDADLFDRKVKDSRLYFSLANEFNVEARVSQSKNILNYLVRDVESNLNLAEKDFVNGYLNALISLHLNHIEAITKFDYYNVVLSCMHYKITDTLDMLGEDPGLTRNALLYMKSLQASPYGLMMYSVIASGATFNELLDHANSVITNNTFGVCSDQFKAAMIFVRTFKDAKSINLQSNDGHPYGFHGVDGPGRNYDLTLLHCQQRLQATIIDVSGKQFSKILSNAKQDVVRDMDISFRQEEYSLSKTSVQKIVREQSKKYKSELEFLDRFYHVPKHVHDTFSQALVEMTEHANQLRPDLAKPGNSLSHEAYMQQLDAAMYSSKKTPTLLQKLIQFAPRLGANVVTACDETAKKAFGFSNFVREDGHTNLDVHINDTSNEYLVKPHYLNVPDIPAETSVEKNLLFRMKMHFQNNVFDSMVVVVKKFFKS